MIAGATAWGLNALLPSWGYHYGPVYVNPYCVASAAPVYNYSQPIVVNTYSATADDATPAPQVTEADQLFDQGLEAFRKGDFRAALQLVEQAVRKSPHDPIKHEVAALCMFATGDYRGAAAVLNNLLSVAPGMDWTTLAGLYGDIDAYTAQLRALEAHCSENPNDAAAHFVLAYHYLVAGHSDEAVAMLKRVLAIQPDDQVSKRMLAALQPPAESTPEAPPPGQVAGAAPPSADEPTTDLVGKWRAERNGDVFELSIDDDSQFTWRAIPKGKPAIDLSGTLAASGNAMLLESADQGTMAARVKSGGPDKFQFIAAGSSPDDPGLSFQRVQKS